MKYSPQPRYGVSSTPTLQHYERLFTKFKFGLALKNSATIAILCTTITLIFSSVAAYGFSRYKFPGVNVMLAVLMFFRMVILASLLVPLYYLFKLLRVLNTIWAIVLGQLS